MAGQLYEARSAGKPRRWFLIHVEPVDDRWVSTCVQADAQGHENPGAVAVTPKFYGVTREQAHRRMVDALENTYDEVIPVRGGVGA